MPLSRREFLKAAGAAGCLLPVSGISTLAAAAGADSNSPVLVLVFLRGGADGLQLLAPVNDPDYVAARPPELRLGEAGERAALPITQTLESKLDFRLHAETSPLLELYQGKRLAALHAVGLTDGTRSHFVAQDLMERGLADEKRISSISEGWLSRALAGQQGSLISAFSATASPVAALSGLNNAYSTPDLASGSQLPWGGITGQLLGSLYQGQQGVAQQAGSRALAVLGTIDSHLPREANGKVQAYQPEGNANYSGDLARSLTSVARLIRMEVGLKVACVDFGGWDTHENQPNRIAGQIRNLASGLAAFHNDMQAANRKVTVLVMTEFGRRLRANKSNGTDHGHGGCWLALGDKVRGGNLYGQWPGLATAQLDQGVDLAVTTDYRQVLAAALGAVGLPGHNSFPGWKPTGKLGLFA
jgi:uncharacterized protein (DUF1501 family)